MPNYFSFSQSEAKQFLANSKTAARVLGLKLVVERTPKGASFFDGNTEAPKNFSDQTMPPTENPSTGKLLIVIPRRVANACGRNLIRRRIKAIYTEQNLFNNGKRYALFVYPEAKKFSYEQLAEFLTKSL